MTSRNVPPPMPVDACQEKEADDVEFLSRCGQCAGSREDGHPGIVEQENVFHPRSE